MSSIPSLIRIALLAMMACVAVTLAANGCQRRTEPADHSVTDSTPTATIPDVLSGTPEPPPPQP